MSETVRSRLRKYKRREGLTVWVGAVFAGLLVILGLDLLDPAPVLVKKLALTVIILGVAFLARARVGFEWSATTIERYIEDGKAKDSDPYPGSPEWPKEHERYWTLALCCIVVAGALELFAVWLPGN